MPLLKPPSCQGCPFYDKGKFFTPDTLVSNSKVMFIAQNPGPDEEAGLQLIDRHWLGNGQYHKNTISVTPQPLIGATGQLFNSKFLPLSTLKRSEVSVGNAIRCRPGAALKLKADSLPPLTNKMKLKESKADIVKALRHCASAHLVIPPSVKVVVAMGAYALFQLTALSSIKDWRGYVIRTTRSNIAEHRGADCSHYHDVKQQLRTDEIDIFATMHIASLFKDSGNEGESTSEGNKKFYHSVLRDFHKIGRFMKGEWPLQLPVWSTTPPAVWPTMSSFDTEYIPDTNELIRWSLCDSNNNLYCVESSSTYPKRADDSKQRTVLIQNALADITHLSRFISFSGVTIEDLMLAHATLWTGELHSLNYINSIFGAFNRYKHLSQNEEQLYSALDAYEPMHIWRTAILPEFRKDRESYKVYRRFMLPLIPIIDRAQQRGVRLNGQRLIEVQSIITSNLLEIKEEAIKLTNIDDFNIGGLKQVGELIYG